VDLEISNGAMPQIRPGLLDPSADLRHVREHPLERRRLADGVERLVDEMGETRRSRSDPQANSSRLSPAHWPTTERIRASSSALTSCPTKFHAASPTGASLATVVPNPASFVQRFSVQIGNAPLDSMVLGPINSGQAASQTDGRKGSWQEKDSGHGSLGCL
jgi:hypothetical protein